MGALRQYRQSGKSIDDTFAGDAREQHPLFFGMEDMDHSMINSLLVSGAVEPNMVDRHSRTALVHYAAMCRTIMTKTAKFMLYSNKFSNTSTPSQLKFGELFIKFPFLTTCVRGILARNETFEPGFSSATMIFDAMAPAEIESARIFKLHGGDLNAFDRWGRTALHYFSYNGQARAIEGLLELGADPSIRDNAGQTPLHVAAGVHNMGVVEVLTTWYAKGNGQEEGDEEDDEWEYDAWNSLPDDMTYVPPPLPHFGVPTPEVEVKADSSGSGAGAGVGAGAGGRLDGRVNPLEEVDHNGDSPASILASFVVGKQRGIAETGTILREVQASVGKSMGQAAGWQGLKQESVAALREHGNQCERMTMSQFEKLYAQRKKEGRPSFGPASPPFNVPLIITNTTTGWDHSSFSKSAFRKDYGFETRKLGGIPYPSTVVDDPDAQREVYIEDFIAHMERDEPMKAYDNDGWDIPLYLFEQFDSLSHFAETYPTLSEAAHPDDVFVEAQSSSLTWQIILGPEGSGAGEHFHLAAINFLVVGGVKQWFITSPEISGFSSLHPKITSSTAYTSKDASLKRAGTYKCIQQAGEAIIVPRAWGHAVINHGDTFGIAVEKEWTGYGDLDSISYFTSPKVREKYRVDNNWMNFRDNEEKQKLAKKGGF
mmetsp:Transcript_17328/g.36191  ORF Transcript_17328/g.36191 Transcript_17328/m.36191 type:complete len:655 (-) Transcript_17328:297-2261(-)